ncbi:MAG: XshC-Cox1 family protein [Actinomycetospora sp.]|nr:XshC-Cox1 family protein [Actinomycetospora sp.]
MRDVLPTLENWWSEGRPAALATVVGTFRSAPRQPGASMLVGDQGQAVGSVSGGCVEGAVYELGSGILEGTDDATLQRFGVSDDDAFAVGLTCGGILDVYVERVDRESFPQLGAIAEAVREHRSVAVATVVSGPADRVGRRLVVWPDGRGERSDGGNGGVEGSTGSARLDDALRDDVRGLLAAGRSVLVSYGTDGERRGEGLQVFVESFAPPPRLIVFGAIDFAAAVARIGTFLGMRVTVCDARPVFATSSRFPEAHEVVVEWPHRYLAKEAEAGRIDGRTSLAVLTHDPKFDVPLLEVALRLPEIGYIGAMGSRRTHLDRRERLIEAGVTEAELARMSSPIGLDLGARTPEETAVSIAAEMIAQQWGGRGTPLSDREGPIHTESNVEPGIPSGEPEVDPEVEPEVAGAVR